MSFAPRHILVPVAIEPEDDFLLAEEAVHAACDIADKYSSKITLLHLAPTISPGAPVGIDVSGKVYESLMMILQARLEQGRHKLDVLQEYVQNRGVTVESRLLDSLENTAQVISKSASELKADLIVICSHGRKGLSKIFLGSVAEKVAHIATVPVLLLHPQTKVKER